jgi:hypothetical protein
MTVVILPKLLRNVGPACARPRLLRHGGRRPDLAPAVAAAGLAPERSSRGYSGRIRDHRGGRQRPARASLVPPRTGDEGAVLVDARAALLTEALGTAQPRPARIASAARIIESAAHDAQRDHRVIRRARVRRVHARGGAFLARLTRRGGVRVNAVREGTGVEATVHRTHARRHGLAARLTGLTASFALRCRADRNAVVPCIAGGSATRRPCGSARRAQPLDAPEPRLVA